MYPQDLNQGSGQYSVGLTVAMATLVLFLGIDGDNIIVGHASYSRKSARGAGDGTIGGGGIAFIKSGNKNDPSVWYGKKPTGFAYPENIDLSSIEKYLSSGI